MAQDAQKIHVGAGRIFVGVTPPATGTPHPTRTPHVDGAPATGTEVGHTFGGSTFTYTPTKADIESDQAFGIVDSYLTAETCELTFTIQERNYNALRLAFDNLGAADESAHATTPHLLFHGGGVYNIRSQTVVLTSRRRTDPDLFEVLTIYKAQSMDPVPIAYSRTDPSRIGVRIRGVHDTTRAVGDQLFQWYVELPVVTP